MRETMFTPRHSIDSNTLHTSMPRCLLSTKVPGAAPEEQGNSLGSLHTRPSVGVSRIDNRHR